MEQNGWTLKYAVDKKKNLNALAEIIENCAASKIQKEGLVDWFDAHKRELLWALVLKNRNYKKFVPFLQLENGISVYV